MTNLDIPIDDMIGRFVTIGYMIALCIILTSGYNL
jgi:hypothetical protein